MLESLLSLATLKIMDIDEKKILYGIIAFILVEFTWEFFLDIRQRRVYWKHTVIPNELIGIMSSETFDKARLYAVDKINYTMVELIFTIIVTVAFLVLDGLLILWNLGDSTLSYFGYKPDEANEMLHSVAFMIIISLWNKVLSLPFSVYHTFVLEEKHGFNKQTVGFYIKDQIKAFIVAEAIMIPVICGMIYIVKIGGDAFFIYLWLFTMALTLFLMTIYPNYIAPLFDKYTPLPEGELRTEIEKLAKSIEFPLYKLYVVEGSKRSVHSNAYMYGFYKNKRIVLFDTLLQDYTPSKLEGNETNAGEPKEGKEKKGCDKNEVLAVLGHEFGHWKLNHVIKNLVIVQVNLFLVFLVFGMLFQYRPMYRAFGFFDTTPVIIGLHIVMQFVLAPYAKIVSLIMAVVSRHFEFQADRYAKSLGRSNFLKRALIKLTCDNLGFPIYDPLYSMYHHSHPPLLERLRALDKDE